jgi:predicted nucleic acid-binding protein
LTLLDANIFMYAAGSVHRWKKPSSDLLEAVARGEIEAAVDAETLQEILHRYRAIGRWEEGRQVYDLARLIVPVVIDVGAGILDEARRLLDDYDRLMARDALHAAVCLKHRSPICSYDRDFDQVRGLRRVEPGALL